MAGREEGSRTYEKADRGCVFSASTFPGFPLQEVWHLPIGATDIQAGAGDFEPTIPQLEAAAGGGTEARGAGQPVSGSS